MAEKLWLKQAMKEEFTKNNPNKANKKHHLMYREEN